VETTVGLRRDARRFHQVGIGCDYWWAGASALPSPCPLRDLLRDRHARRPVTPEALAEKTGDP
jgi:hypothetical protein